ncbi:MAG: HU family DNA-binding protein [Chitinophagales bacterium]|nr:HU family DNA-binding protein [Chitinophagales bacterium]
MAYLCRYICRTLFTNPKNYLHMNKGELVEKIAKDAKLSKSQAGDALDAVLNAVTGTLAKGGKVTLVGFGTFSVSKRSARKGRNPQTGKEINIKAKKVAKFKAGAELAKKVNK